MYFPLGEEAAPQGWEIIRNDLSAHQILGIKKTTPTPSITVVVFHGNAGSANMRQYYQGLIPADANLVINEYPGFGLNHDGSVNQENMLKNARQLMQGISKELDKSHKIVIIGESIGSALAAQIAVEFKAQKLLLVTPYHNIASVAQSKIWFLPSYFLIKDRWDTAASIQGFKGDTMLVVASNDKVIEPKFAYRLYEEIRSPKEILKIESGHNDWIRLISLKEQEKIISFMQSP